MQQLSELLELFGALEKIHHLLEIIFHICYLRKENVVHFKLILFIFLLAQSLNAKPIILKADKTPIFAVIYTAIGGIITELIPNNAVVIPPTNPLLSGKNLIEVLIVAP